MAIHAVADNLAKPCLGGDNTGFLTPDLIARDWNCSLFMVLFVAFSCTQRILESYRYIFREKKMGL